MPIIHIELTREGSWKEIIFFVKLGGKLKNPMGLFCSLLAFVCNFTKIAVYGGV